MSTEVIEQLLKGVSKSRASAISELEDRLTYILAYNPKAPGMRTYYDDANLHPTPQAAELAARAAVAVLLAYDLARNADAAPGQSGSGGGEGGAVIDSDQQKA